jgi:ribonuclease Z
MLRAKIVSQADEDICLHLQPDNHAAGYLCDCGVASDLDIKERRDVHAIYVSHTHIDHFAGFDAIMRHQLAVGRALVICGPAGMARRVSARLNSFTWNLMYDAQAVWFEVRELWGPSQGRVFALRVPDWEPVEIGEISGPILHDAGPFTVRATLLDHGTPTVAYRLQEPSRVKVADLPHRPGPWVAQLKAAWEAGDPARMLDVHGELVRAGDLFGCVREELGHSVGFVMDHLGGPANHARIAELMHGVDDLFIECYYAHEDLDLAITNHHSTALLSGQAARLAGAKRATPCHFSRRYNTRVEAIVEEFNRAYQGHLEL